MRAKTKAEKTKKTRVRRTIAGSMDDVGCWSTVRRVDEGEVMMSLSSRHEAHPACPLGNVEPSSSVGLLTLAEHPAVLASLKGDDSDDDLSMKQTRRERGRASATAD